MTTKQRLQHNINALRIVLQWDGMTALSEQEIETIRSFGGWGAQKQLLYGPGTREDWEKQNASKSDMELYDLSQELFQLIEQRLPDAHTYIDVIDSIKNATMSSHYTPKCLTNKLFRVLSQYHKIEKLYEPSAGSGVFVDNAIQSIPELKILNIGEKDTLTNKILCALYPPNIGKVRCYIQDAFEETNNSDDNTYDAICSNVPFGQIKIWDDSIDKEMCGKIHNYFVAKGLTKLKDGGIMAYIISDGFLNTPSNEYARKYLYQRADHISVVTMPDNLMWESAGTMAPSHMIVVRKRDNKQELSQEEEWLCTSKVMTVAGKEVYQNEYIKRNPKCVIGKRVVGKNQYGKASIETVWDKSIEECADRFGEILERDLQKRYTTIVSGVHWKSARRIGDVGKIEIEDNSAWIWENATDIAIQESGLSDIFKTKEEWEEEYSTLDKIDIDIANAEHEQDYDEVERLQKIQEPIKWPNTIPFKPGTIIEYEGKLIQVQKIDNQGNITEYSEVEVKGKEGDILRDYISVRDEYIKQQE